MKVMLLKDVYNLGRAGDVKKVANGYARNFLIPQKMAVPATAGATVHVDRIKAAAVKQRELVNEEMSGLAAQIAGLVLIFKAKVGESGKLFGSITPQMIAEAITEKISADVDRHWIESQPLREAGNHKVKVRLTFDLIPEVKVIVESDAEEKDEEGDSKRKRSQKAKKKTESKEGSEMPSVDEAPVHDEVAKIKAETKGKAEVSEVEETPSAEEPPAQGESAEA